MKITYTSPNASHHYRYARELDDQNYLFALISGWPRFAPKGRSLRLHSKLVRVDHFQCLALLFGHVLSSRDFFFALSNSALDSISFEYASKSDIFLYYRTSGVNTNRRIKAAGLKTVCIMEEVNSHVLSAHKLILQEYLKLGFSACDFPHPYDVGKRLDAYQISDYILCPSSFVKRSLQDQGIPAEKIIVNSFGMAPVTLSTTTKKSMRPDKEIFRVLYVGQINIRKGLRYLVEAFGLIRHSRKELVLVGPMTSCTGLEKTMLPDNIYFKGLLSGNDLSEEYFAATVFVLPSIEEGMALVIGEAMASGLPVIATTNTGAEDIMIDGKEGFIVRPCDSSALADALQAVIDNPRLRDQMAANSLATATSFSSWQASTAKLANQFSKLIH